MKQLLYHKVSSNFCRSLEMLLIDCKVELKLRWRNHFVLSATDNDNTDADPNNTIFTTKDTKLYFPNSISSGKYNPKLLKPLSKGFARSVFWNEYITKNENNKTANEYTYFLESNIVGVTQLFVLIFSNQDDNAKRYKHSHKKKP